MEIIRLAGECLIAAGTILLALTLINAKRQGTFEALSELRKIRQSGYTREHREEKRNDVYRNEHAEDHSRLMSRRAQRVLEKMEAKNAERSGSTPSDQGAAKENKGMRPQSSSADPGSGRNTVVMPIDEVIRLEKKRKGTDILSEDSGTDILKNAEELHEGTAVLTETSDGTAVLDQGEGTALLEENGEGTAVLGEQTGTAVLEEVQGEPVSGGTDILPSGESTDLLLQDGGTDILDARSLTDTLPSGVGTAILAEGEGTAVLEEVY